MKKCFGFAKRLRADEDGASGIEYGLLAALVAVGVIGAVATLGENLTEMFEFVTTILRGAVDAGTTGN
jgi:pilus assembly protein Flp/PilA